jgi:hypothetical protein
MESIEELREKLRSAEEKEKQERLAISRKRSQCVHKEVTRNKEGTLHECAGCGEPFLSVVPNQTTNDKQVETLSQEIDHQQEQLNWHNREAEELSKSLQISHRVRKRICPHSETRQQFRTKVSEYTPGYGLDCQLIGTTEFIKDTKEEILKIVSYETVYIEWICNKCGILMKTKEMQK